jgi:hypothetical protein
MLMTLGHYHGYSPLPLRSGVSIAAGYAAWRTFTRDSREVWLELAADAARLAWPDDPMIHDLVYVEPVPPANDVAVVTCPNQEDTPMGPIDGLNRLREMQRETEALNERVADAYVIDSEYDEDDDTYSLEKLLAGCCTPGKPCPDHIDDVIEDWQEAQLDRHPEHGAPTGAA